MEAETKFCTNCKRDISSSNFVMHEMHCRRHIVLCDECDEPIPRSEAEQHFNDVHQKVPCELCKKDISKDKMEDHMENLCLKKQMMCEYCELSCPKDGFEAHIDYCGSRTECCTLCQQYVMLKDMTQHEVSGCTYPEPKPPPTSTNHTSTAAADPFSMSYLQDFLASDFSRVTSHVPSNLQRQQARQGRDRPSRGGNKSRTTQPVSKGRQSTRNKSNVNSDRERGTQATGNSFLGSNVDLPPDMDYDTMLALQLAHEDMVNQEGNVNLDRDMLNDANGLNYHWQHFSDNNIGTEFRAQTSHSLDTEDDMAIECEVCHLSIPVDMYIEHAEYCLQGSDVNNVTAPAASTDEPRERNNVVPVTTDNLRSSIPVIDNLHQSGNSYRMHTDNLHPGFSDAEDADYCLPCEFCEEVYPSELILQHQVVCPKNMSATPRSTTPASGFRSSRRRDKDKDNNQVRAAFGQNNFSSSPLATGLGSFGNDHPETGNNRRDDNNGDDNDNDEDGLRSNFFRDETYKTSLQSISDKYGGPSTTDRGSYYAAHRSGRRNSNNRDTESNDEPPRTYEPPRANRSAQRARARLNQLLQDNDGSIDNPRSSNHSNSVNTHHHSNSNSVNSHHRRGAAASSTATGTSSSSRARKSRAPVDARTVIREVNRDLARASQNGATTSSTRSRVSNGSSAAAAAPTNATSSTSSRNRQRSDHVFSPELRPKPSDNRRR